MLFSNNLKNTLNTNIILMSVFIILFLAVNSKQIDNTAKNGNNVNTILMQILCQNQ